MPFSLEPRAEWVTEFPWLTRLREISPVSDHLDYLWPRYRADHEEWWLYRAVPVGMLEKDRIAQFAVHWTDLPKTEQQGRKRMVTDYQFYMFRRHRVDVTPFWILQGSRMVVGGTPYSFTDYERKMLEAEGHEGAEPIPPGTLPQIPFDERVVQALVKRDNLIKHGNSLEAMKKANRGEVLKAQDELAEKAFRKKYLEYHRESMAPQAEFYKWWAGTKEAQMALPDAPEGLANDISHWREDYIEKGYHGVGTPTTRKIQIAVR